jgi:hypothetical protein
LGDSLMQTLAGVMELVMRALAVLSLSSLAGYTGLCFASPLAWSGALIPLSAALFAKFRQMKRMELTGHP